VAELIEKGEMPEKGVEVTDLNGEKTLRKVPVTGLKAEHYRTLLKLAVNKLEGKGEEIKIQE
jgi:hypothetical protein